MSEDPKREEMRTIFSKMKAVTQEYVNATEAQAQGPALVDKVLVVYELVKYDEDGEAIRSVNYTTSDEMFSPISTIGLAEVGRALIRQEILGWAEEEQE